MSIEPIGLFTLVLMVACLCLDYSVMIIALVTTSIFGAAAAVFLGGANIPPAHLFIAAVALATLVRRDQCAAILTALHPTRPGFWIFCFVAYGLITAFFYPKVMSGLTQIIPLGTSQYEDSGFTVPLGPVSSNFTQSIYMISSLMVFLIIASLAATSEGFRTAAIAATGYVTANVAFGILDVLTYLSGTQGLMDFMRNANYAMHTETAVEGMKRIAGAFAEASTFARASLGAFGFIGTLWLCGHRPWLTGPLTAGTFVLGLMSTSSTAIAMLPVMVIVLYMTALTRCGTAKRARISSAVVLTAPLLAAVLVLAVVANVALSAAVYDYLDLVVLSKAGTDSGVERGSWNAVGFQNFRDSGGLGVGLGTIRTSSYSTALLGGVGLVGTLLYLIFLGLALLRNPGPKGSLERDVRMAARNGCMGLIAADMLVGSTVDQGLFFFTLAAIASARPERSPGSARSLTSDLSLARVAA
ncbi:hypothetical protein E4191_22130 (plasmid) [Paracoccus liaowanqingii]|uniref:Uncharacterized protein n=1 Tax=Paracoccus liaowanqingii TaxID=2560053 RepID=A0A4Y5SVE7_9RHOB|nr:hypothetical protein [Paracoccus liaowanqingii]QDA36785.1 hypothetical protein E4191_22130 [Paracoccus liaowanqingii]